MGGVGIVKSHANNQMKHATLQGLFTGSKLLARLRQLSIQRVHTEGSWHHQLMMPAAIQDVLFRLGVITGDALNFFF